MRFQVVHHTRPWRRVDNHLDARHCPICGATVHGPLGQREHRDWHVSLRAQLDSVPVAETDGQYEPWTAAVGEDDGQQGETG